MFIRDWDKKEFDSEDEAFQDAFNEMLFNGDIGDYLQEHISYSDLLDWAMKQDGFYDYFGDKIIKAQQNYFNDFYVEMEDDEDEDS